MNGNCILIIKWECSAAVWSRTKQCIAVLIQSTPLPPSPGSRLLSHSQARTAILLEIITLNSNRRYSIPSLVFQLVDAVVKHPLPSPPLPPPIHRHKGRKNFRIRFINLEVIRVKPRNISTVVCDVSYVFVGVLLFIFKWIDLMGGRWRWGEGKVNWWVSVRLPSLDMSSNCREKWLLSKKCDVGGNRYCCWRITRVSLVELDGIYSRCILWMVTYFYGAIVSNRWSAACWLWRQCVAPELIPASIASKLLLSSPLETRSRWRGLHFVYIPFSLLFQLNCWFFSYCSPSSSCYSPRYYLFPSSANYRVRTCQKFDFYPHSRIS